MWYLSPVSLSVPVTTTPAECSTLYSCRTSEQPARELLHQVLVWDLHSSQSFFSSQARGPPPEGQPRLSAQRLPESFKVCAKHPKPLILISYSSSLQLVPHTHITLTTSHISHRPIQLDLQVVSLLTENCDLTLSRCRNKCIDFAP